MSEEYQTTDQLTRLVSAAKIGRLFWVDDQFGRNTARMARLLATKLGTLWRFPDAGRARHPQLQEIPRESDPDFVEAHIRNAIEKPDAADNLADEILDSLDTQIAEADPEHASQVRDLTPAQFREIRSAFEAAGAEVVALSYSEWVDRQEEICSDLRPSDLVFVDHDFSSEEGCDDRTGEIVLKELLGRKHLLFTCILFTHGTSIDEQKSTRDAILERLEDSSAQHAFSVVSKESITKSRGTSGYTVLSLAFKDAFLSVWCHSIAEKSRRIFDDAFNETANVLRTLGVEDLSAAFFRKPFADGTSEFDVLLRIFVLAARVKLEDQRAAETFIWERLAAIRRVLAETPVDTVKAATNTTLQEWHEREIFDPPQIVNALFSPVLLGDLFEHQKTKESDYYVLVGQPCDLAIRENGFRKSNEALFLKVTIDAPPNLAFGYKFDFPKLGTRWINFAGAFSVNLNLLDLVSFRDDGRMMYTAEIGTSELMLPGVVKKLGDVGTMFNNLHKPDGERTTAAVPAKYQRLALGSMSSATTVVADRKITFPIARIGRIRSPYAEAILGGLAIHHTRVAFEYNFADLTDYCEDEAAPEC